MLTKIQITPGFYAEKGANQNKVSPEESSKPASGGAEDKICTICFSNDSNCIIMNCKHSGICKECAIDMMKKKPECPFCRIGIEKVCVVTMDEEGKIEVQEEIKKEGQTEKPDVVDFH